jgi:ribosomal silencing factor RsfS
MEEKRIEKQKKRIDDNGRQKMKRRNKKRKNRRKKTNDIWTESNFLQILVSIEIASIRYLFRVNTFYKGHILIN